jgi:flagellar basal-body rod modification protein FlgD
VADYVGKAGTTKKDAQSKDLDKDTFLKLLVAQLKYQDPMSPAQGTEFIAQTAQFTTVEKLTDLAETEGKLLAAQQLLGASSLIGRSVNYTVVGVGNGTGVVSSASFTSAGPTVRVGDVDVPLSSITRVAPTSS